MLLKCSKGVRLELCLPIRWGRISVIFIDVRYSHHLSQFIVAVIYSTNPTGVIIGFFVQNSLHFFKFINTTFNWSNTICTTKKHVSCEETYGCDVSAFLVSCLIFQSSPPSALYMRQWIGSALVQTMVCRRFGAKPLSKTILCYCQLDPREQTSMKF